MIKKIVLILTVSFAIISCSKQESGNKAVVAADGTPVVLADNGEIDSTVTYRTDVDGKKTIKKDVIYKASDNTLVKVIFDYTPEKRTISIRNNNKTFILDKVSAKPNETLYEKEDIKATVKADSIIINQGKNIIELEKTKI
ncbi:hypothetical protein ASG01_06915 [Chryseobacterium sp. Leaf180]|uniref:hypothetical protein n=1 Tax=Chryseobacterium sp. Leaf180 TaxID=1736289 RepID=UPI0006F3B674|nr:hypothetical protein [Chryseobacterium sp. Leaf180]KQR95567.1 hypothetical protein ASG01_06915 [Chryseobacterium sp. Leaf180]